MSKTTSIVSDGGLGRIVVKREKDMSKTNDNRTYNEEEERAMAHADRVAARLADFGWEEVTAEETWKAAREQLKCYRENEIGTPFRCRKRRIKKEANVI